MSEMSGDGHTNETRERHVMPLPPDGQVHRNGMACPCRPAIHHASDGAWEFIHQAIVR